MGAARGVTSELSRIDLQAGDRRIVVRRRPGPPGRASALLLHALAGSWRWWRDAVAHLSPEREILVPDRPGFGGSSGLPLTPAEEADLFAAALAAAGVTASPPPWHVVGHSMGGAVAAELAARHPSLVASLTLIDAAGWPTPYLRRYANRLARPWSWCRLGFIPVLVGDVLRTRPLRLATGIRRIVEYDLRPALSGIAVPVCVVWGERDRLFPPEQGRAIAESLPNARWEVVSGAGHIVPADRPAALARVLDDFWGSA